MTGWLGSQHRKSSDIMRDVLEGRLNHDDAPESVQSMITLQYHHMAVKILGFPRDDMKKALDRVPETCRMQVRKRMLELWRK